MAGRRDRGFFGNPRFRLQGALLRTGMSALRGLTGEIAAVAGQVPVPLLEGWQNRKGFWQEIKQFTSFGDGTSYDHPYMIPQSIQPSNRHLEGREAKPPVGFFTNVWSDRWMRPFARLPLTK